MTWISGITYTKWGPNGTLETEAACAVIGALAFIAVRVIFKTSTLNEKDKIDAIVPAANTIP